MTGRAHVVLAVAGATCVCFAMTRPAHAQSIDLQSYWSSLQAAPSIQGVQSIPVPAVNTKPDRHIVDGLQYLRKYELSFDRSDVLRAIQALQKAVDLRPSDAFAHYALGAALARGSDIRQRPYAQRSSYKPGIYSLAASHAPRELKAALDLAPQMDAAAFEYAQVALDLNNVELLNDAMNVLSASTRQDNERAIFMIARIENRVKQPDVAVKLAAEAMKLGYDKSLVALEQAIAYAEIPGKDADVARAYFEGVDNLTPAGAEAYLSGLYLVASRSERSSWREATLEQRKAWLHSFWRKRAAVQGVPEYKIIKDLYVKMNRAMRARGVSVIGGVVEAPHKSTLLGLILPRVTAVDLDMDFYAPDILEFSAPYKASVVMAWEALQFRVSPRGGSQVVGALNILPQSVKSFVGIDGVLDATVSVIVADTAADVITKDSVHQRFDASKLSENASVLLAASVAAPPARHALVRVAVETSNGFTGGIGRGYIDVDAFNPDSLNMSDIVLSPADARNSFERGAIRVSLAPGRAYTSTDAPVLYYEVYGISASTTFNTRIELQAVKVEVYKNQVTTSDRGEPALSLSFNDVAQPTEFGVQQKRELSLAAVKPGTYMLRVTVSDGRGRTTMRRRFVDVVSPRTVAK